MEQQKKSNTTLIIIIILAVIVVGLLVLGLGGYGIYYWLKNKTPSPVPTPTTTSVSTPTISPTSTATIGTNPSNIIQNYMICTLGTIPGASLDYEYAKKYLSAELKELFNDVTFVPTSYCIQQGPDEVEIASEDIDGMEATVRVRANWGGDWQTPWEFLLIYGSDGWIIKEIKCLDTGQVTK